ncbi:MAG: hypothetical protein ACR2KK_01195 [Acidimicrobiales bacterium]
MPRWLITSIHRGRLWELRDQIYDEVRLGCFGGEEERARSLIAFTEQAIVAVPYFTPGNLRRTSKHLNALSDADRRKALRRARWLEGGSPRLLGHRERLHRILNQQLLTGSWRGILITVRALGTELVVRFVGTILRGRPRQTDDVVSVSFRAVKVEVRRGSPLAQQVLCPEKYLPFVGGNDHADVLTSV